MSGRFFVCFTNAEIADINRKSFDLQIWREIRA